MPRKRPRKTLTHLRVKRLEPPKVGQVDHFDAALPGFALRVTTKGHKSWVLFYRIGGRQRRYTIGSYPAFELAEAREEAREAIRQVAKGIDPATVKARQKAKAERQPDTFAAVADLFVKRYAKPKTRSWRETERIFEKYVNTEWRKREIHGIARDDVIDLLDRVMDRNGPYMANRVLAAVRKLFNWCLERGILDATPVANVKAPGDETERDRVLSDDELKALWETWDNQRWPFGPFFQLLLVTAQRRGEVAQMRWADINFEERVWTLPREMTKGDRSHEVPLSSMAMDILGSLPRLGDYVFAGRKDGRPISGFSRAKKRCDTLSGIGGWRLHDLRRSAGTNMAKLEIAVSTISRVMNHKEGGVTKIYDRHSYLPEKRRALETWSRKLASIIRPGDDDRVVPLRG